MKTRQPWHDTRVPRGTIHGFRVACPTVSAWHRKSGPRGTENAVRVAPSRVPRLRARCLPFRQPSQPFLRKNPPAVAPETVPRGYLLSPARAVSRPFHQHPTNLLREDQPAVARYTGSAWHDTQVPCGTIHRFRVARYTGSAWHDTQVPRGTIHRFRVAPSRVPRLRAGCLPFRQPSQPFLRKNPPAVAPETVPRG